MVEDRITTTVDSLIELLKKVDKIELEKAAKQLGISTDVVQSWVDFLVEEKIVGIEYKFTTPYVYLNKDKKKTKEQTYEDVNLGSFKEAFRKKAIAKQIPEEQINDLWKNHLLQKLEHKKKFFLQEAGKRGLRIPENIWDFYKKKLLSEKA